MKEKNKTTIKGGKFLPRIFHIRKATKQENKKEKKELQERISKILFNPSKEQIDKEVLEIIVLKDKAHYFDFLEGYTFFNVKGRWNKLDENNVLIQVEFKDTASESIGKKLIKLLTEYNEKFVGEDVLYTRIDDIEESSL